MLKAVDKQSGEEVVRGKLGGWKGEGAAGNQDGTRNPQIYWGEGKLIFSPNHSRHESKLLNDSKMWTSHRKW